MDTDTLSVSLHHQLGNFYLQLNTTIALSGVTAIFGPSGCGKTTLLRMLAGFDTPDSGHIVLGNDCWLDTKKGINQPPHHRPVGTMFQDTRLFPHLNVQGNLNYAEKRSRQSSQGFSTAEVVDALDIAPLLAQPVTTLSGGEKQRVALARTLLTQPKLLMLDEPLSALDTRRKAEIMPYLEQVVQQFATPTLYVSHAMDEVTRLADSVLAMENGQNIAYGRTVPVFAQLDTALFHDRSEVGVVVEGQVLEQDEALFLTYLKLAGQTITMPLVKTVIPGNQLRLRIRARNVAIATERPEHISIRNILPGTLTDISSHPGSAFATATIDIGDILINAHITRAAVKTLGLKTEQPVFALIKSVSLEH